MATRLGSRPGEGTRQEGRRKGGRKGGRREIKFKVRASNIVGKEGGAKRKSPTRIIFSNHNISTE